jgi:chemotaxis regulatin CheY-phosphate phosphatase CheZ
MSTDGTTMKQSELSRIDIVSKYMSLQEELTSLAVFIDETRKTLGGVHEQLPSASDALSGVTKATEKATHNILAKIEQMMEADGELMEPLSVLQAQAEHSDESFKNAVQAISEAGDQRLMVLTEVMTELSFQDLTCQAIQRISSTILEIERRLHDLIEMDEGASDATEASMGILSGLNRLEEKETGQSRQDLVDEMFSRPAADPGEPEAEV